MALQLSNEMQQQGLQPCGSRFLQLFDERRHQICACSTGRPPERTLLLFDEMQQLGLQPNGITVLVLFDGM